MVKNIKKNKKILEYDLIRVIAVIAVLISHCSYYKIANDYGDINFEPNINIMTFSSKFFYIGFKSLSKFLYTFHMPLFIALSGALFKNSLNNNKYKTLKELVIKKGKSLLIPFFIVTVIYLIPIKYMSGYYSQSTNLFKDIFVGQVLQQGITHLWFLPTLFCIFVISYIYIYIQRSGLQQFATIKKTLLLIILICLNIISSSINIVLVKNILTYLVYFYIGFLFEDKREKLNKKIDNWSKWKYILFILEIGAIFIIFKIFDYESNIYLKIIRSLLNIVLAIIEISLIYIIAYKLSKIEKIVQNKIIKKISEYSFGIYLYSDPINYILLFIMSNNLSQYINTTAGIIGLYFSRVFITFSISIIITYVLRNMKMKYIC